MIKTFYTRRLEEHAAEEKNSAISGTYYLNHGEYARPTNHLLTSDEV